MSSLNEIATLIGGNVIGDGQLTVSSISPIDDIKENSLVFAEGEQNIKNAEQSKAVAMLVSKEITNLTKPLIQVVNPLKAFIILLKHFYPDTVMKAQISPSAIIADDVIIGKNVFIGPLVVIGEGAKVGDNCVIKSQVHIGNNVEIANDSVLHPHVVIYDNCKIGANVIIHAASVIGSDGFGYTFTAGEHLKIPHVGNVVIEDNVEIGANTVVDRATLGATTIGKGTKIDNFVQIAHSVKLGTNNIVCAFTGIAGSTVSGNNVIFAANVGVSDHVRIDDDVILGARAGVPSRKHLKSGNIYLGNPARPKEKAIAHELSTSRIPIMRKTLRSLSERVKKLEKDLIKETDCV